MKNLLLALMLFVYTTSLGQEELYFPPVNGEWETISPQDLNWCESAINDLNTFLEERDSRSFIILKGGKIAIESYYNGHTQDDSWYWASAGKSLTSFLIGMAQEQGLLNIQDLTSDYLGEGWTTCSLDEENNISLIDQMRMVTGIDYSQYDGFCTDSECLICSDVPGEEWYYQNGPYTLLTNVLEEASGQNYNVFTFNQLFASTGITGLWTPVGANRIFFSKARSMARFGLLCLAKGIWEDTPILADEDYLTAMVSPSQNINPAYGYLWWLNGQETFRLPGSTIDFKGMLIPDAPSDAYLALGANSQIIMVIPSEDLVVIRQGNDPDSSLVPTDFLNQMWNKIEALNCSTATSDLNKTSIQIEYVNNSYLSINPVESTFSCSVYTINGELLTSTNDRQIDVRNLDAGVYLAVVNDGRTSAVLKFVKLP